jgi:hypothetical protein
MNKQNLRKHSVDKNTFRAILKLRIEWRKLRIEELHMFIVPHPLRHVKSKQQRSLSKPLSRSGELSDP